MNCPKCHGHGVYDRIDAKVMRGLLVMSAPVEVLCDEPDCKEEGADCGHESPSHLTWERENHTMCERCFAYWLETPHGRAYEQWFVERGER